MILWNIGNMNKESDRKKPCDKEPIELNKNSYKDIFNIYGGFFTFACISSTDSNLFAFQAKGN